jgi:hypothetical protein
VGCSGAFYLNNVKHLGGKIMPEEVMKVNWRRELLRSNA